MSRRRRVQSRWEKGLTASTWHVKYHIKACNFSIFNKSKKKKPTDPNFVQVLLEQVANVLNQGSYKGESVLSANLQSHMKGVIVQDLFVYELNKPFLATFMSSPS